MDERTQLEKLNAALDAMFDDACIEYSQFADFFPEDCTGIFYDSENCSLRLEFKDRTEHYAIFIKKVYKNQNTTDQQGTGSEIIPAGYDCNGYLWLWDSENCSVFVEGDDSPQRGYSCDTIEQAREMLAKGKLP